jgi:UDP-arabinose 4-epimerase
MSNDQQKKVLVTGGAGYVGSHACKAISKAGYLPIACDNLVNGNSWSVKWGPLEKGDILNKSWVDSIIKEHKPVAIFHFAAHASVAESLINPFKYYKNNFIGTLNLLESMKLNNINNLIFSSTCAIYGTQNALPISEDAPKLPINPYGASKLMVERMMDDYSAAHGIRSISLRYFNAAGADLDAEIGEIHNPETHLIPIAIRAAQKGLALPVYGNNYDTHDGTAIRDYIHVSDLADAHVLALKYLQTGGIYNKINLGTGKGYSVREVISETEKISGKKILVKEESKRAGDPACLVADSSIAKKELEWQPKYSDLSTIITTAWNWYKDYSKIYNV